MIPVFLRQLANHGSGGKKVAAIALMLALR